MWWKWAYIQYVWDATNEKIHNIIMFSIKKNIFNKRILTIIFNSSQGSYIFFIAKFYSQISKPLCRFFRRYFTYMVHTALLSALYLT